MSKNETKANIITGLVLLIIGIGMIVGARDFERIVAMDVGPGFFPTIIGSLMAALSAIFIIINTKKMLSAGYSNAEKAHSTEKFTLTADTKRVLVTIALLAGYIALIPFLGFMISSGIYLIISMCLLAEKLTWQKVILYAIMSIVTAASLNLLFTRVFWIMLPRGTLF